MDNLRLLFDIMLLRDYNTRIVTIGTSLLGIAGGVIGVFLLLRKRALISDAISHATLPGIAGAYIIMQLLFGNGKFYPGLVAGALISGLAGMACVLMIRRSARLKEDTAIGITLSVFFGIGAALLGSIQGMRSGHAAGLEGFIYGKTASMVASDAILIGIAAVVILFASTLLIKEFSLVCFDQDFAAATGYPVTRIDMLMIGLSVMLTVIGLQAVGLILIIALLILPAAAARFWTMRLRTTLILAACFGGVSGFSGAIVSAFVPGLPAGALIVVAGGILFLFGILFGYQNGLLTDGLRSLLHSVELNLHRLLVTVQYRFDVRTEQHILSDAGASAAGASAELPTITYEWLRRHIHLAPLRLALALGLARHRGIIVRVDVATYRLTPTGVAATLHAARNHELQHLFVRTFPESVQGMHQRDEQYIEHYLSDNVRAQLEDTLQRTKPHLFNPHAARLSRPARPERIGQKGYYRGLDIA